MIIFQAFWQILIRAMSKRQKELSLRQHVEGAIAQVDQRLATFAVFVALISKRQSKESRKMEKAGKMRKANGKNMWTHVDTWNLWENFSLFEVSFSSALAAERLLPFLLAAVLISVFLSYTWIQADPTQLPPMSSYIGSEIHKMTEDSYSERQSRG